MIYILSYILLVSPLFAQNQEAILFNQLRERHTGKVAAPFFIAQMDEKSARTLLRNKIKGSYQVHVAYHTEKGIQLIVKSKETFYENVLSSYANYMNTMLLPLLSTSGYTRLQKRFTIKIPKKNLYQVNYKKGDDNIQYYFKEGSLGLVDNIAYLENGKKIFVLDITWEKIGSKYIPTNVKSINYDKTRVATSFGIKNIQLK